MADKLVEIFATVLKVDPTTLSDDSSPENTQSWDSMNAIRLVTAIEESFSVELTTVEIMKMRTLGLARNVLRRKGVSL